MSRAGRKRPVSWFWLVGELVVNLFLSLPTTCSGLLVVVVVVALLSLEGGMVYGSSLITGSLEFTHSSIGTTNEIPLLGCMHLFIDLKYCSLQEAGETCRTRK